jgi:hypothetical protein
VQFLLLPNTKDNPASYPVFFVHSPKKSEKMKKSEENIYS